MAELGKKKFGRFSYERLNARKIGFEIFRALVDARDVRAHYWVEILSEGAFSFFMPLRFQKIFMDV